MSSEALNYQRRLAEVTHALTELRQRLRPLLDRLMPQGYGVRSFSRATGLELTSAWRCWTVAHVADPSQALRAMPGARAWAVILQKLEERLGTSRELDALRDSVTRLETLIRDLRLNRGVLRAMAAGGLDSSRDTTTLLEARRASMRSNAKLFGVQCKTRLSAVLLAPGSTPGAVSLGYATCFDRIARTRPGLPWPILRETVAVKNADSSLIERQRPLGDGAPLPSVIRSLSSRGIVGAELRPGQQHSWKTIDLADVPAERSGRLRFFTAEALRDVGSVGAGTVIPFAQVDPVLLPMEFLVFDVLVHARITRHTEPTSALHATIVSPENLPSWQDSVRLPLEANIARVESLRLPARLAALNAGYRKAIERVTTELDTKLDDYEVFRLLLPHPPLASMVVGTFEVAGGTAGA